MRAFYSRIPTAKELEGTGFTVEDYAEDDFEVWPENMPAIRLFSGISTQWRTAITPKGIIIPIGLDYNVLFCRLDRLKLSDQEYEWMFNDIRAIESVAISEMNKKY